MTVTSNLDLLKYLRSLEGYGLPSVQNDLVEQAPHAVALFYTLILTHGYLQRLYNQTDADEVNVELRFDSPQEGSAGEIIGAITMDREKADAVDWNHIDSAYSFSYAPAESTSGISKEVRRFNQSSGYSLPEVPAVTVTSGPTDETTSGSGRIIAYVAAGLGFLIFLYLWRLFRTIARTKAWERALLEARPAEPPPSFDPQIADKNRVPFSNIIQSLFVKHDIDSFQYWRDKLLRNRLNDAQEYVARLFDAVFSCGIVQLRFGYQRRLIQYIINHYGNDVLSEIDVTKGALGENDLIALETFDGYNNHPDLDFRAFAPALDDAGAWSEAKSDIFLKLATTCFEDFDPLNAASSRYLSAIGDRGIRVLYNYLGFAAAGQSMRTILNEIATQTALSCLRAAETFDELVTKPGLHVPAAANLVKRLEAIALRYAARVSPEEVDYAKLAREFQGRSLALPAYEPFSFNNWVVRLDADGAVTAGPAAPDQSTPPTNAMTQVQGGSAIASAGEEQPAQTLRADGISEDGYAELDKLVGLKKVKELLSGIRSLLAVNSERQKIGLPPVSKLSLHAVFTGNPGTGKTTVARIYAAMLKEFGYLRSGQLVEADRGRLVAGYLGQTAVKTTKVLQDALGGVLFIDEAYALKNDPNDSFGQECIDTLLKFIEDHRDDLVVIAAGYKDRIDALLETNPGFKSRFAQFLTFDDYTDEELLVILQRMANAQELTILDVDLKAAVEVLGRERIGANFGNARAVRNLLERAIRRQANRLQALQESGVQLTKEQLMELTSSDLFSDEQRRQTDPMGELDALVGLEPVKQTIRDYRDFLNIAKLRGQDLREVLQPYFVMTGNPGTGKTTVARIMGSIFKELDYLPSDHLVEAGREDLVAGYIGQTAIKTREVLKKALGGTLFIDEAYSLTSRQAGGQDFGSEAIEALLKFMEDNRGRLVIIVAGYDREMQKFLNSNPGLRSRFTNVISFPDYSPDECAAIFLRMLEAQKFKIADGVRARLSKLFENLKAAPNWSNGRDVRTLLEFVSRAQARRLSSDRSADQYLLTADDIDAALREFMQNKLAGA